MLLESRAGDRLVSRTYHRRPGDDEPDRRQQRILGGPRPEAKRILAEAAGEEQSRRPIDGPASFVGGNNRRQSPADFCILVLPGLRKFWNGLLASSDHCLVLRDLTALESASLRDALCARWNGHGRLEAHSGGKRERARDGRLRTAEQHTAAEPPRALSPESRRFVECEPHANNGNFSKRRTKPGVNTSYLTRIRACRFFLVRCRIFFV
ncbi:hypothetical protein ABIA45_007728 [Bradyrhizobium sp. USDA 336]